MQKGKLRVIIVTLILTLIIIILLISGIIVIAFLENKVNGQTDDINQLNNYKISEKLMDSDGRIWGCIVPEILNEEGLIDYSQVGIEIAGYSDCAVTDDSRVMQLVNAPSNPVYLIYSIYCKADLIYESGLIPPGKMEEIDMYSMLEQGVNSVDIYIQLISANDRSSLNSAKQTINITKK